MMNFVTKFHNLDGDLVHERKKSFCKLLKETSRSSNQFDIDNAIQNLHPKTYQEKLFWVETLIFFKKTVPLMELLKQGNREYVKMIVRQKWFIEDAFKDMSAEELINDFFPCVSYSTRLKLLRRISNCWSEEKVDALFDATQKRYGPCLASIILHGCSISKFKDLLQENEFKLNPCQVISILNKNEDLLKIYLDHSNKLFEIPYEEKNVTSLIASKNPLLYLEVLNANKVTGVQLPKVASAKVINIAKKEIIEDPKKFAKILNGRVLVEKLGADFKLIFKNMFPKTLAELNLNSNPLSLLKHFPKNKRWEIFYDAFNKNYPEKNMEEVFLQLDSSILKLNPPKDVVRTWAKTNYESTNDENFLKYYSSSISIPLLKEKINVTSDKSKRYFLLTYLISTCAENQDMEGLDDVLNYLESRHKNEDAIAFKKLTEFICKTFSKGELLKKHWEFISRQLTFIRTRGSVFLYAEQTVVDELLRYSYQHDKNLFRAVLSDHIKEFSEASYYLRIHPDNPDLELNIFVELCKMFPEVIPSSHKFFVTCHSSLLAEFIHVCVKYPKKCLNLLEFQSFITLIETVINKKEHLEYVEKNIIRDALLYHLNFPQYSLPFFDQSKIIEVVTFFNNEDSYAVDDLMNNVVNKKDLSEIEKHVLTYYMEILRKWSLSDWIVEKLIDYHPTLLMDNFEKICGNSFFNTYKSNMKHYSHLNLDKLLCEHLKNNWSQLEYNNQKNALEILLNLLPDDELIEFFDKHFSAKQEEGTSEDVLKLKMKHMILDSFKKRDNALKFLTLQFWQQNDMKYVLPSLYSLFYRSPENKLHPYIQTLSKHQSLSVRKHSVFLSCELLDYTYIYNLLSTIDVATYSRKYVCLASLNYFAKNSNENLFILVKQYLETINKYDKETLSKLAKIKITKRYRARYIELCWKIFENVDHEKTKTTKYFDKLLEEMINKQILKSISTLCIENIIKKYFSIQGKNRLSKIDKFAVVCLAYKPENSTTIFEVLTKLNNQSIRNFAITLVDFICDKKSESKFMENFVEKWNKHFPLTDSFDETIIFNLLLKYSPNTLENYSKFVIDYLESLIYQLGHEVFHIFKSNLEKLVMKMNKLDQYKMLYSMLNYKCSATTCVLVIQLLTENNEENKELNTTYRKITKILSAADYPIVRSYYYIYINCE